MDARPNGDRHASYTPGDYARAALKRGLEFEKSIGVNPYKVGFIGATDSHTGLATAEEDNFWGKSPIDDRPENRTKEFYRDRTDSICRLRALPASGPDRAATSSPVSVTNFDLL